MIQRVLVRGVAAVVLMAGLAGSARAVPGPYFWGWGCGGSWYPPGAGYSADRLPYYALYPPVYYSGIVPRTYGQSPYAYPAYPPAAVPPQGSDAAAPVAPSPSPRLVINPYVSQPEEVSSPARPADAAGMPLVVYPAALRR